MNWLAHVFLSEPDIECRLGNLLADMVKGKDRQRLSERMRRGVRCHQFIDAVTDFHPVVGRSKERVGPEHRRFAGILVDVFYDHFLARNFACYSAVPFAAYVADFYDALRAFAPQLPEDIRRDVLRLAAEDLLGSYLHVGGVAEALRRISLRLERRLGRRFCLETGVGDLLETYGAFEADFREFFPDLCRQVARWNSAVDQPCAGANPST